MEHPMIVALVIAVMTSPLMTSARPTVHRIDVDGSLSSDLDQQFRTEDIPLSGTHPKSATALQQASEVDETKREPTVSTTENIREKFLQLNNFDRLEGEASSDGLLARLAHDQVQHPVYGRGDTAVHSRRARDVTDSGSGSDSDDLPAHYRRHLSQPPIPFDDGANIQGRSVCPWRYEDDFEANRFPHTLRVAVKTHTGSRCIDPATGAPRRDLRCLPVEYKLNVLRKDSEEVWQISPDPEYVTVGYTCARSRTA
ncbi:uncharacterized protein LOC144880302 [Branchiostoma floridae x Branchiostoma japonicum]